MKKILLIALALITVFALSACDFGSGNTQSAGGTSDPGTSVPGNTSTPGESTDRFTEFGLSIEQVQPEGSTDARIVTDSARTYNVVFSMPSGVTQDDAFAYYKKIYELTAAVSEGGTNYKKTGGSSINPEVGAMGSWEDEHSAEAHMNDWFIKYNGKLLNVTIICDVGSDSEISVTIADYS